MKLLVHCLAISNKYQGYIAKANEHQAKLSNLDTCRCSGKSLLKAKIYPLSVNVGLKELSPSLLDS